MVHSPPTPPRSPKGARSLLSPASAGAPAALPVASSGVQLLCTPAAPPIASPGDRVPRASAAPQVPTASTQLPSSTAPGAQLLRTPVGPSVASPVGQMTRAPEAPPVAVPRALEAPPGAPPGARRDGGGGGGPQGGEAAAQRPTQPAHLRHQLPALHAQPRHPQQRAVEAPPEALQRAQRRQALNIPRSNLKSAHLDVEEEAQLLVRGRFGAGVVGGQPPGQHLLPLRLQAAAQRPQRQHARRLRLGSPQLLRMRPGASASALALRQMPPAFGCGFNLLTGSALQNDRHYFRHFN
ncbi:Protein of unknown function [Gryllus bimaculatus]|nr:Protein of unknown function [Gryllus bimaculatus]